MGVCEGKSDVKTPELRNFHRRDAETQREGEEGKINCNEQDLFLNRIGWNFDGYSVFVAAGAGEWSVSDAFVEYRFGRSGQHCCSDADDRSAAGDREQNITGQQHRKPGKPPPTGGRESECNACSASV